MAGEDDMPPKYFGNERRRSIQDRDAETRILEYRRVEDLEQRMRRVEITLKAVDEAVAQNTRITLENKELNQQIFELVSIARSTWRFLILVGNVIKWLGGLAVGIAALWALWYSIRHPDTIPTSLTTTHPDGTTGGGN